MKTKLLFVICCLCIAVLLVSCTAIDSDKKMNTKEQPKTYEVKRLRRPIKIDADWDKAIWQNVEPMDIDLYMGKKPSHLPKVQAKLLWDDGHIYIIYRVEDKYVRAVAEKYNGNVWEDSCAEFFFNPSGKPSTSYFNIEANCCGSFLIRHQSAPDENIKFFDEKLLRKVQMVSSIKTEKVYPEITDPLTWTLEYCLPLEIFTDYTDVTMPAPGVVWRANLFKCADKTSHPHWITWSFIDNPTPRFHAPEYFGTLKFVN